MSVYLKFDTKVALLLTTSFPSSGSEDTKPLTPVEWNRLFDWLLSEDLSPGALMKRNAARIISYFDDETVTPQRVESLLDRDLPANFLEWDDAFIRYITSTDSYYPATVRIRLRENAPPVLFARGDIRLLDYRYKKLAVFGSNKAGGKHLNYAAALGKTSARHGCCVVSRGASRIEKEATFAAIRAGGHALWVVPGNLRNICMNEKYEKHLRRDSLLLLSHRNPDAELSISGSMERNRIIYGLVDSSFIVHSGNGTGITWDSAIENLRNRRGRLWVRKNPDQSSGNARLENEGASPAPWKINELDFPLLFAHDIRGNPEFENYGDFLDKLKSLCSDTARKPAELGELISISNKQFYKFLWQAEKEEKIKKIERPRRYVWINWELIRYEAFLERLRDMCSDIARETDKLREGIPASKFHFRTHLSRAEYEEKVKKLPRPQRYLWIDPELEDYEALLERIRATCSGDPCEFTRMNEKIPVVRSVLERALERAASEEKLKKVKGKGPRRYIWLEPAKQHELPLQRA